MLRANAWPSGNRALGGSSSVTNSTSKAALTRRSCRPRVRLRARCARQHRKSQTLARIVVALRHCSRQLADAADVAGALGHADGATRIEQIEGVTGLEQGLVGGKRQIGGHQTCRFGLVQHELVEQNPRVGELEIELRLLDLVLMEHVTVAQNAFRARRLASACRPGRRHCRRPASTSPDAPARR